MGLIDYVTLLLVGGRVLCLILLPVQGSVDYQEHEVPHKVQGVPASRGIPRLSLAHRHTELEEGVRGAEGRVANLPGQTCLD